MPRSKYTIEQVRAEFDRWCRGEIGTHTMGKREYNTFKRRTSRYGLRKPCIIRSPEETRRIRREYMRSYRLRKRSI
jgi:hypothetical protein